MQTIKHFLTVISQAFAEMQKVRVATALARMGHHKESKEALK